jgi:hypothetical protein
VGTRTETKLELGRSGLFDLQDECVAFRLASEQQQKVAQAEAALADVAGRDRTGLVAAEKTAESRRDCLAIVVICRLHGLGAVVAEDLLLAVVVVELAVLRQLGDGCRLCAPTIAPQKGLGPLESIVSVVVFAADCEIPIVEPVAPGDHVPAVDEPRSGEPRDRPRICRDRLAGRLDLILRVASAVALGDDGACGEPAHVPLPRSQARLVEVVQVEHSHALRRPEGTEISEMRIA